MRITSVCSCLCDSLNNQPSRNPILGPAEFLLFLKSLSLRNFRNYKALDITFGPSGYLFLGGNAQGKTNLLEAIHYLCTARSQRTAKDEDLIRYGTDQFLLRGSGIGRGNRQVTVEILFKREVGRRLKVNGSMSRKISDLSGLFCVVNFAPEDVAVVGGPPRQRRRFVNFCICQVSASYWASLMEYQRILQQRNMALRSRSGSRWYPADNAELEAWDRQLVAVGSRIIRKRDEVLGKMNPLVSLFHQQISDGGEQLSLTYKPACELSEEGEIEGQFQKALAGVREKERKFGMTLVGPHRDDVIMSVNGLDLRAFGSQGQQRTAATALKLAAASFLEETMGEQPILLLDDIFAELDRERTRLLFNLLVEYSQLFIATAKESDLAGYGKRLHRMAIVGGAVRAA